MVLLLLFIEAFFLIDYWRRIGPLSSFFLITAYAVFSQLIYSQADYLGHEVEIGMAGVYAIIDHPNSGPIVYFFICCIIFISSLGLSGNNDLKGDGDTVTIAPTGDSVTFISSVVFFVAVLHVIFVDKAILLNNEEYLYLNSKESHIGVVGDTFFGFLQATFSISTLVAVALSAHSLSINKRWAFAASSACAAYGFLFQTASSSRMASVILAFSFAAFAITARRYRWLSIMLGVPLCFLSYIAALAGRSSQKFGLENIPQMYSLDPSVIASLLATVLLNSAQGIFLVADGINYPTNYSIEYKLLSFSPLPSLIDGFDYKREALEYRMHDFIPMPAIAEIIHFGPFWICACAVAFGALLRTLASGAIARSTVMAAFTSCGLTFLTIQAGGYPVRNVFRQFLLFLLVLWLAERLSSILSKRNRRVN